MKKRLIVCVGFLICIPLLVYGIYFVLFHSFYRGNITNNKIDEETIWLWDEDDLDFDKNENIIYVKNELLVFIKESLSEGEKKDIAHTIKGSIVGELDGAVPILQIQVEDTDLGTLKTMANQLSNLDTVYSATYDIFMGEVSDCELTEPWSEDPKSPDSNRGHEELPNGNDWWAEAVEAYSAWNYIEENNIEREPITIGIMDSGFSTDEEDLRGKIKYPSSYYKEKDEEYKKDRDHGTGVASIVAANGSNGIGLRGICDNASLQCVNFKQFVTEVDTNFSYFIQFLQAYNAMIKNGVIVINNSFGYSYPSEETAEKELEKENEFPTNLKKLVKKSNMTYEVYLQTFMSRNKQSNQILADYLYSLVRQNKKCIFVQAAGNGIDNMGPGVEAKWSGFFCGIESGIKEGRLREYSQEDTEEILNRIIIVGGIKNTFDGTSFEISEFSNYGEDVTIFAPGGSGETEGYGANIFHVVEGGYTSSFGTSDAAPIVTGICGLLWSVNQDLSSGQVRDIIVSSSKYVVNDKDNKEYPIVNLYNAVRMAMNDSSSSNIDVVNEESLTKFFYTWLDQWKFENNECIFIDSWLNNTASFSDCLAYIDPTSQLYSSLEKESTFPDGSLANGEALNVQDVNLTNIKDNIYKVCVSAYVTQDTIDKEMYNQMVQGGYQTYLYEITINKDGLISKITRLTNEDSSDIAQGDIFSSSIMSWEDMKGNWCSADGSYVFHLGNMPNAGDFSDAYYIDFDYEDIVHCNVKSVDSNSYSIEPFNKKYKTYSLTLDNGKLINNEFTIEKVPDEYTTQLLGTWYVDGDKYTFEEDGKYKKTGNEYDWGHFFVISDKQIVMGYSRDHEYKIRTYSINGSSLSID